MFVSPEVHAGLLGGAAVAAIVFAGIILARNPKSRPARMHAIYGGLVAWWFVGMAMAATADSDGQVELWGRLVHLSIGALPAVAFHLNVATAGQLHRYRRSIRAHYVVAFAVVVLFTAAPWVWASPHRYAWGPYPAYTAWGLIPAAFMAVAIAEGTNVYRRVRKEADPSSAYAEKMTAFYHGNMIAAVALVDFLAVFGFGMYPLGFVILTIMHAATVFGSIRYRLIEITPEFAAEQVFETLPDAVIVVDTQGLIRVTNKAGAEALGCDRAEVVNRPLESISPQLAGALESPPDPSAPREVRFHPTSGDERHLRVSGATLADQKRAPVGVVWVLHDLTAQRLAEAEKRELEGWVRHVQKLETLGVMAGGIAHDFNNLLMVMLGSADLASKKHANGTPIEHELRTITRAAERATELTTQMLTYAGETAAPRSPVDLNELCRETAELLQSAVSKKVRLEFRFGDDLPSVIADKGEMGQVVLNLITNASEALGDEVGTITLRTGVSDPASPGDDPSVFIEVSDTGVGMDAPTQERIFDPFFTTKVAGRGLGLATVAGIVRGHSGQIRVDTVPGRGTRFTVELPAGSSALSADAATDTTPKATLGSGVVLLADDDAEVRRVAHAMLVEAGYDVIEAVDGRDAVSVFQERSAEIDLVVLDVAMPVLDGKEAFVEIRACMPEVPIVVMSGHDEAGFTTTETSHHSAFLKKPFRSDSLVTKLGEAMTT